jgi:hypothetical protein
MRHWTYKNGVLGVYGFIKKQDGELRPSRLTNTAPGQERGKNAQAGVSNVQEHGVVGDGQEVAQGLVLWELFNARKESTNGQGRVPKGGLSIKRK